MERAMADRRPVQSPCVSVCVMNPATGWCEGCFRTIQEIGGWLSMSPEQRAAVMTLLPSRRAAATARTPE